MRTQLYIENQEVELNKDVQFLLNKQFEEISNPTIIINDWSKTVSIPFTEKNNKLFGYIYRPEKTILNNGTVDSYKLMGSYFDPTKKLDFKLIYNSNVLMEGYAKMNEIKQKSGNGTYEITLYGQLGKVFQEMKKITFDTATEDPTYLIHGEDYVEEYINKDLVYSTWNTSEQIAVVIQPKYTYRLNPDTGEIEKVPNIAYRVTDIIGFAPNNSFSNGFDYKTTQIDSGSSKEFKDILEEGGFIEDTGVDPDTAIPNGLLPREIGEYRSYLQLPYIYWNKLFQIFKYKAQTLTGYQFELDNSWFNQNNPYWFNLVYMLNPLNSINSEHISNHYVTTCSYWSWPGPDEHGTFTPTPTNLVTTDLLVKEATEAFEFIDEWEDSLGNLQETYPAKFVMNNEFSVLFTWNLGLELLYESPNTPYSFRLHPDNYLKIYAHIIDAETNQLIYSKGYVVIDSESPMIETLEPLQPIDRSWEILKCGEFSKTGEPSNYKIYLPINPSISYIFKYKDVHKFKLQITAGWNYSTYRFIVKWNSSQSSYANMNPETKLLQSNNSTITATADYSKRSNNDFTLNDLWDNKFNIFEEVLKYCKMYRISINVDEINKKVIFKPFTNYFSSYTVKDWTNKIDKSKNFNIKPITLENKYILFNYKDNDTMLGKKYFDKYGVKFGEYRLVTDYNFNSETTELFEDIPQSIVNTDNVLSWTNLNDNHNIIYSFPAEIYVYNKDKDNKEQSLFGAFYFHNGLANFSTESSLNLRDVYISDDTTFQQVNNKYFYTGIETEMQQALTYPKLDIVRDDNMCVFNVPKENYTYLNNYSSNSGAIGELDIKNTIYSNFWKKYLEERYNVQNKKITCYVKLTPTEYNQFKWNQFVRIENQLCMVNKIYDYDVTSNIPTKVDLITIQDISGYTSNNYV